MMLYGHDAEVTEWVARHLGIDFGLSVALGIVRNDRLIAGVIFNNYRVHKGESVSMEVTIGSIDRHWATRHSLRHIFSYSFAHVKVRRLQATVSRKKKETRRFLERLGFRFEGIARKAWHEGGDAAVYSMLATECKWIDSGKICTKPSARARPKRGVGSANAIEQRNCAF